MLQCLRHRQVGVRELVARVVSSLRTRQRDADFEAELAAHLDLAVDFGQEVLRGKAELRMRRLDAGAGEIVLDTRDLAIDSVTVATGSAAPSVVPDRRMISLPSWRTTRFCPRLGRRRSPPAVLMGSSSGSDVGVTTIVTASSGTPESRSGRRTFVRARAAAASCSLRRSATKRSWPTISS